MNKQHFEKYVPDDGPVGSAILMVGEAPGETEHDEGRPFVGESGKLLVNCLSRAGLARTDVRLSNLCHYRPYGNKFENLLGTPALREGILQLYEYIKNHRPTVIAALGGYPLTFLTGKRGIKKWRGSILPYIHDESIKVIPTLHPAAVLRDRGLYPTFDLDIKRIVSDAAFTERRLPVREFVTDPRGLVLEEWTQRLCDAERLACDIETVKKSSKILCVGFSPSPGLAVCIVPGHPEGHRAIERILESQNEKIFQNGNFDITQLRANGFTVRDPTEGRYYYWDTLIAQHVIAPELPRSLEYLTSIYTREPYYKTVGRGSIPDDAKAWSEKVDKQSLYEYNCRDCCCTFEVYEKQKAYMDENVQLYPIFNFEMDMLEVAAHISQAGMSIDQERREMLKRVLISKWEKKQFVLDRLTGYETNVRSPKLKEILYDKLGLPIRRKREGTITTDEDAIVSLIAFCKDREASVVKADTKMDWQVKMAICQTILEIRGIRQVLANYLMVPISDDGRVRATYKVGGTETGRWSGSKYVDGTGFNPQTMPRDPVEVEESQLTKPESGVILVGQLGTGDIVDDEDVEEAA